MTLDKKTFAEQIALYGADLARWPDELRLAAEPFLADAEYEALLREAALFESQLRRYHAIEPPHADLPMRIVRVAQALNNTPRPGFFASLRATFEWLMPHPGLAFASVLMMGCAIGLTLPSTASTPSQRSHVESLLGYSDSNGEIL